MKKEFTMPEVEFVANEPVKTQNELPPTYSSYWQGVPGWEGAYGDRNP